MPDRHIVFQSGTIELEGIIHLPPKGQGPAPGVVVCHPHPLHGGDMDNPVVLAACDGLAGERIAALRFNFRGTGQSQGSHDRGKAEQDDVLAALQALRGIEGIDTRRLGLAGYSFGAGVALATVSRSSDVRAVAAIAPALTGLGSTGAQAWAGPKLILLGDADSFIPLEKIKDMVSRMAQSTELQVLAGADHFFEGYDATIAQHVGRFFARHLG